MGSRFRAIGDDQLDRVAAFVAGEVWPFHGRPRVDAGEFRQQVAPSWIGEDAIAFWVIGPDGEQAGIVRAFELGDVTPLVDLRIASAARGRGLGTSALDFITQRVFESRPEVPRLGGYTRADNVAMRRVFEKCGWVQEAYYRSSWTVEGAPLADSVGHAILRSDWASGTTTPIAWP